MSFVKFNSSEDHSTEDSQRSIEVLESDEPIEVKPENRPYAYENSQLPVEKRPY